MPHHVVRAPGLGTDVVLTENSTGGEQQRKLPGRSLVGRNIRCGHELPFTSDESIHVHDRRALRRVIVTGPLHAANVIEQSEGNAGEGGRDRSDLIHDLARVVVMHVVTQSGREGAGDLPLGHSGA